MGQLDNHHATSGNNMTNNFRYLEVEKGIFLRFGHWGSFPNKKRGTVCLLNGRTEFMEKYFETINQLNQRGFDVFSFDWRGQGLSTRILENRRKGYVKSYDDYVHDLAVFIEKIFIKNSHRPFILIGHSMGGHIALRFLHEHDAIFEKAILMSPMFDIRTFPIPKKVLQKAARLFVKFGYEKVYIAGSDRLPESKFKGNSLTSDKARFEKFTKMALDNPEIAIGGVTFGWLNASFDSIDLIDQPGYVEKIKTPILIFSAGNDRIVSNTAQTRICNRLPNCRLIKAADSQHEIFQEKDVILKKFWNIFEQFSNSHF